MYSLGPGQFYIRKRLEIDPGEHLLNWVDVESLRLAMVAITGSKEPCQQHRPSRVAESVSDLEEGYCREPNRRGPSRARDRHGIVDVGRAGAKEFWA
ncbi:MAG TPA: hypothetical protein PLW80_08055, partial [Spirochaetales bacterium]|nr:hypothetical protein [Spirochaetales bacterium]